MGDSSTSEVERANLAVIVRLFAEVFDTGNVELLDVLIDESFEFEYPGARSGRDGLKAVVRHNHGCFERWRFELHDRLADGDRVVVRWTASGVHVGSFAGERPTGREVRFAGTSIFELRGSRIVADWVQADMLGFLRQLGVDLREPAMAGGGRLVERFWSEVVNAHAPEAADALMAAGYVQHVPGIGQGPDGFKEFFTELLANSTGMRATITGLVEIDDLVVSATTVEFSNPPPEWASVTRLVDVFRVRDGRLTEHWDVRAHDSPTDGD